MSCWTIVLKPTTQRVTTTLLIIVRLIINLIFIITDTDQTENMGPNLTQQDSQAHYLADSTKRMQFNISELPRLDFTRPGGSIDINQEHYSVGEEMTGRLDQRLVTFKKPTKINDPDGRSLYFNSDTFSGRKILKADYFEDKECICIEDQDGENR